MSPEETTEDTANDPVLRNTREAVREKAQQVHAKQSRARLVRRIALGTAAVVVVGALGVGIGLAVSSTVSKPLLLPAGMDDDGVSVRALTSAAEPLGSAAPETEEGAGTGTGEPEVTQAPGDAVVDIHIFVDYLSPGAGDFERANAEQLQGWVTDGAVTVTYYPVSLLTANSNGTRYSLRAAGAAACVATYAPDRFTPFNHALLIDQPAVDSDGRSDEDLVEVASAAGVRPIDAVRDCIMDRDFLPWAKDATTRALAGPLPGTDALVLTSAPTVVVNGQAYVGALTNPAEFSQFVLTVASEAYYSATPTPTPAP